MQLIQNIDLHSRLRTINLHLLNRIKQRALSKAQNTIVKGLAKAKQIYTQEWTKI